MDSLNELFEEQLRDLYSAENQLLKALPRMAKKASTSSLRQAFETHTEETRVHVERIVEITTALGIKPGGHKCKAMEGLIEEGKEVLEEKGKSPIIDVGLIASAQRIEHYEISGYGTARTLAKALGLREAVAGLDLTAKEEGTTDKLLTSICTRDVLPAALAMGDGEEEEK